MGNTMTSGSIEQATSQACFRQEPVNQPGDCHEGPSPIRCIPSSRNHRLLVVDDEKPMRRMLSQALRKIGRVDVCENGHDALKQAGTRSYDVVISDMDMPGMNGLEFYRQAIFADESVFSRFIFISGEEHPEIKTLAERGSIVFLKKPFLLSEMRNAVETVIHRNR